MLKRKNLALPALVLAMVLVAGSGCIFSPEPEPCEGEGCGGGGGTPVVWPDTPDKLMANFQAVYERTDFANFAQMLHPQYVTILQESTYQEFPDVGTTLDLEEELHIHERMFSKQDVYNPLNQLVPGIQSIAFQTFQRQGAWSDSPPNDQIPNARFALYEVVFLFDRGAGDTILKVEGQIKFYAVARDSTVNGVTKPYYRMRGQVDLTRDS
ncbi:MAG: hypothetical protein IPK64_06350 [bacterium]|nr:hypothetical protein [bacterium]